MKKIISAATLLALLVMGQAIGQAAEISCPAKDSACKDFAKLTAAGQFEKLIARVDARQNYSGDAKGLIGQAYLLLAGKEGNTPEQEEQLCRKALEYGATSAYMRLYFLYAKKDREAALGFLKQYVATKPDNAVPYVLLGEAEIAKKNYASANAYLLEAKKVTRGSTRDLDWTLFQTSYLTGDYYTASSMLNSAFSQGKTVGDLKALIVDPRYSDMGKRSEFKKLFPIINGTTTAQMYAR
jgi:tetratricopeptide (TPR) repeat protein